MIVSEGGVHTITTTWHGHSNGTRVAATTTGVIDGGAGTMTNTFTDFTMNGAGMPAGPIRTAFDQPTVMTRRP